VSKGVSEDLQPKTIDQVYEKFKQWLYIEDFDVIDTTIAASCDRRISGLPIWFMIIGAPGSIKTVLLMAMLGIPDTFKIDSMTSRSIISGRSSGEKGEPVRGLAVEADGKVLVFTDFTDILSLPKFERGAIFGQMRSWFDGHLARRYGMYDRTIDVDSKVGLIAAAVPFVDHYTSLQTALGERYLKYRYRQSRQEALNKAKERAGEEDQMAYELRTCIAYYFRNLNFTNIPHRSDEISTLIGFYADIATRLRTFVPREHDIAIEIEQPTRLCKQFIKLATLLAIVRQKQEVTKDELRTIARVAEDCCSPYRLRIVKELFREPAISGIEISQRTEINRSTTYACLDDLERLKFVTSIEDSADKRQTRYSLVEDFKDILAKVYNIGENGEIVHGI